MASHRCLADHPPVSPRAAIAHARSETIQPSIDGNGRVGRILLQRVRARRRPCRRLADDVAALILDPRYIPSTGRSASVSRRSFTDMNR
jgi:hypothetical protein